MIKVTPSILSSNAVEAKELIAQTFGLVDRLHIDVIDGVFADNLTVDPGLLSDIETTAKLDFHLMVKEPINWIEKCMAVGADRIIAQIELMGSQQEFVEKVHQNAIECGLALDLESEVASIDESVLVELEVVLIMSVKAGFGGQDFDRRALAKVEALNTLRKKYNAGFAICVDGGVTPEIAKKLEVLGVDEVIVGRRLFKGNLADNIKSYQ